MLSATTPLLTFIAFLLLLLISLSAPIIKPIFLFHLAANASSDFFNSAASASVNFGLWGYCISTVDVSVVGIDHSTAAQCSKSHLGYTFDNTVTSALHATRVQNLISKTTTAALVLHPIAAGFTFVTFVATFFTIRRDSNKISRLPSIITLSIGLIAAILTTIVFLIDVIFVAIVRRKVHDASDGDLNLNWGNAVWMALGAAIALWMALVVVCTGTFATWRRSQKADKY